MTQATILLVDNGSRRPESTLNLRRLARNLGEAVAMPVHPVSLQHADRIPAEALEGIAADTLHPFLAQRLAKGERRFIILPLFFGPSRALTSFIPDQVAKLSQRYGEFELIQCDVLCPLPQGEPRLARILYEQLPHSGTVEKSRVILVDHGSPIPEVTAVRRYLAGAMRPLLGPDAELSEAVMERREGSDYDFNGRLLEELLLEAGEAQDPRPVLLSLLFLSPGRHAGPGGDIAAFCERARANYPNLEIRTSELVGEHAGLIQILRDRLSAVL